VLTACSAQGAVRGYGMIGELVERLRAYWLDPAQFDPQREIIRKTDKDMALLDYLDRFGYRPHRSD